MLFILIFFLFIPEQAAVVLEVGRLSVSLERETEQTLFDENASQICICTVQKKNKLRTVFCNNNIQRTKWFAHGYVKLVCTIP